MCSNRVRGVNDGVENHEEKKHRTRVEEGRRRLVCTPRRARRDIPPRCLQLEFLAFRRAHRGGGRRRGLAHVQAAGGSPEPAQLGLIGEAILNAMKRGLRGGMLRVPPRRQAKGGPAPCCTPDWICQGSAWTCACSMNREREWPSPPRRPTPTVCAASPSGSPATASRSTPPSSR